MDFTSDISIALSFATSVGNYADYINNDFSIICFEASALSTYDKKIDKKDIQSIKISLHKEKLNLTSIFFSKHLYNCTYKDLAPRFKLSSERANDRMKYQKGLLIFPVKGVVVNGEFLWFSMENKFFVIEFSHSLRSKLKKEIEKKYPEYTLSNLMNPFNYFMEYDKE